MFTNELTLNVLTFSHANKTLTVYLSQLPVSDSFEISEQEYSRLGYSVKDADPIYCSFAKPTVACTEVTRALKPENCLEGENPWSLSFLKKYYNYCLKQYFKRKGIPVSGNIISDTEVWIKSESPYPDCSGYRVFRLRVQFNKTDKTPELIVAMDDIRSVYNKSVTDNRFSEMSESMFNKVLYETEIFRYEELPDQVRRNLDKVYPCISFNLLAELNIKRPTPDKSNRYLKYRKEIDTFRMNYLEDKSMTDFIHLSDKWKNVIPSKLDLSSMKMLQFGGGLHAEPKYGVRQFGPHELIKEETVFFFIMHADDKPLAYTLNEYLSGKRSEFQGGLSAFLRMKYNTEPRLSIVFTDKNNPLPEIRAKLKERTFISGKQYVAIYLSPFSKWTRDAGQKGIYYQLKELLLTKGIVSQTIGVDKTWGGKKSTETVGDIHKAIVKDNFHYSLPNILVAVSAKLGATPWCFGKQPDEELVIGISAYKSRDIDNKYVGSAFSFTNEGRFQGFECFKHNQIAELAGSIALAVKEYCKKHTSLSKLVIHFYKRLSWRELKPIEKALSELGLEVPVVVVSVNKGFSADIVGFDLKHPHLMPLSGTYFPIESSKYLLFNNQLRVSDEKLIDKEGYPFPLKISLQQFLPDSNLNISLSEEDIRLLLTQVCRFSQLYWKSVSRQWLPVTLRYPEMLAQIVPHFKYMDLPEMGRENLWFL